MPLKLKLSGSPTMRTLSAGTLSIGRGEGNDWVLPDPQRHLSKTHCVVSIERGQWVLTDLSTNGVYVNGASQPTIRDSRLVLTDGDSFRVGDYSFEVEEAAEETVTARGGEPGPLDIDPLDDPLAAPVPQAPGGAFSHPVRHQRPSLRLDDPFDRADAEQRRVASDQDLFRGPTPVTEWTGPSKADHADAPRHAMPVARVLTSGPMPEIDFDALIGDLPGLSAFPAHAAPAGPAPANPYDTFDSILSREPAGGYRPEAVPGPAPAPIQATATAAPAGPSSPPVAQHAVADPPPGETMEAALRVFMDGAGLAVMPPVADARSALLAAGEVFRALVEGLREVLMSRATVKGELRVEQTMIRSINNNPLKFSMTPEDAVVSMLGSGRPGYMPPITAASEAVDDIKTHELAVMAGVQTALVGLLRRFDPEALEARLSQGMLESLLPAARKARLWDSFRTTYESIASEAEDDFQAVFGRAFAKAYMAQLRK